MADRNGGAMKTKRRWITWELQQRPGEDKPAKVPFNAASRLPVSPLDPAQWMSYDEAVSTGERVGFVFTESDNLFFLDLDGVLTADGWSEQAIRLVHMFPGAYVETSVSGTGLHVVGTYTGARPEHGTRCAEIHGELYTADRFMALGTQGHGDLSTDHTEALANLVAQRFPPKEKLSAEAWSDGPREGYTGPTDDDDLIRRARQSRSSRGAFKDGAAFDDLWTANESVLSVAYPDSNGRPWDGSSADAALARHLAFWTGCDCERIKRLMFQSALHRDKWARTSYIDGTINVVVASATKIHDKEPEPEDTDSGNGFLTVQEQLKLFKGHIYITSHDKVMTPDGKLHGQSSYNTTVRKFDFVRDVAGLAGTTRKPWEAFRLSQGFQAPMADTVGFEPSQPWDLPLEYGGVTYANTYRPIDTPRIAGDATPFLVHIGKLLPNEHDRAILLAYLAAIIQHKGVKFQWAPLLQGCQGNGKTLITDALKVAVGERYFHSAQPVDLAGKFNYWLVGKILIGIEELATAERSDLLEALKPMITNTTIGTQDKGVSAGTSRVCGNFILNSNHKDAIQLTRGDRRYAIFYTAQQDPGDLIRDGMGGDYFDKLYNWLRKDGYGIVHHFLDTYDIPDELNPAKGCQRAPNTSSTDQVLAVGVCAVGEEIQEAVAEERPGFRKDWISRTMLTKLIQTGRLKATPRKLRQILEGLEYMMHPALPRHGLGCRTNEVVEPDGCKSELWVRKGSLAAQLTSAKSVVKSYERAQATSAVEAFKNETVQK